MKGKLNLKAKIITIIMAIISVASCLLLSISNKEGKTVYAANEIFTATTVDNKQQFSAKFGGDVLFSVEKVLMSSTLADNDDSNDNYDEVGDKTFYQRTSSDSGGEERKFYNYYHNDNTAEYDKYVVSDGSFVMLDNEPGSNGYISADDAGLTEVIIVSFGQYVYSTTIDNGTTYDVIKTAGKYIDTNNDEKVDEGDNLKPTNAGVVTLNVSAYKNGSKIDINGVRDVTVSDEGVYHDFMYIIPQLDGNEGYYTFEFNYLDKNRTQHTESFSFYLLYKTSYTGSVEFENNGNTYNINPTLGWVGDGQFQKTETDGYVRYKVGENGISWSEAITVSYPTITYDYSKYKFSYTHTANGKATEYVYSYSSTESATGTLTGSITYTATSSTGSTSVTKPLQYVNETDKLVTIVLTDPGTYLFEFEYIYAGYNATTNPEMNLQVEELPALYIHGADLQYSKYNYQSAEMKYLQVSYNSNDKVDLIFPNAFDAYSKSNANDKDGKDIADYKNSSIDFIYELVDSSTARVGDVIIDDSENEIYSKDTLINAKLKVTNTNSAATYTNDYSCLTQCVKNSEKETELGKIADKITYQTTNQGSLWFTMNDTYKNSFYFYNANKLTGTELKDSSKATTITSETTFNTPGYYLVFLKVHPNGMEDTNDYYQIFAFQYSTSTVNIEVKESTGLADETQEKVVGAGKFTNQDVKVSWAEPDVFERAITANFYTTTNTNLSRAEILKTSATSLINGETLGNSGSSNVASGSYLKFLIELKTEGESATYKMFTIDRQDISGVMAYVVSKEIYNNASYYQYYLDTTGNIVGITNAITDSYSTLDWSNKASGANITTTYTYTPFVKNSATAANVRNDNSNYWISTNYTLGTTIGSFNLTKSESKYNVDFANVLYNQGIYVFTLTDEAGNTCKYLLVIDRTEAWFEIDSNYYETGSYQLFGDTINFNVGTHKVFALNEVTEVETDNINYDLYNIILGNYDLVKYFKGSNTNKGNLSALFQGYGGNNYLTVKNVAVAGKDPQNNDYQLSNKGKIEYSKESAGANTSTIRTLYVKGANNIFSSTFVDNTDAISKITIEINTDNAKGMVFYFNEKVTDSSISSLAADAPNRLYTGSDKYADDGTTIDYYGIQGAQATDSGYVAFIFNVGSGDYEVSEVSYKIYTLNLNNTSDWKQGNTYYYTSSTNPKTIFANGATSEGAVALGDGRVYIGFGGNSTSQEGLYVVTRTYAKDLPDGSSDVKELSYYFIVDRNGIIDVSNNIGNEIKIKLLESETEFNTFSSINVSTGTLTSPNANDNLTNETYGIYLTTTKLPATLSIPAYKYFNGTYGSAYYAGELNFMLFFIDSEKQLADGDNGSTKKIFDTNPVTNGNTKIWGNNTETNEFPYGYKIENGYYTINIYDYLISGAVANGQALSDRLCTTDYSGATQKTWLSLPGTYVLYIYDNINPTANKVLLGFKISKGTNPIVDIKSSFDENNVTNLEQITTTENNYLNGNEISKTYGITTNAEFVNVILPSYDNTETRNAQVDTEYLKIQRYFEDTDSEAINYMRYEYQDFTDDITQLSSIAKEDANGNLVVSLDTYLTDSNGYVIQENLNKELYYLVTIRYKLNYGSSFTESAFANCYKYYDANGKSVYWYETTYKIVIDRQAPTTNLNNLVSADPIIEDYNTENETDDMFEHNYHSGGNSLYFTYQYVKYYAEKQKGNENLASIYALYVNSETIFNSTDVEKVLYNKLSTDDIATLTLSLPILDTFAYTTTTNFRNGKYSDICQLGTGYYEIVELDAAGNATQYVVYYDADTDSDPDTTTFAGENLIIPVTISPTNSTDSSNISNLFNETSLTMFGMAGNGSVSPSSYFFKINLSGNGVNKTILTNFAYSYTQLSNDVASLFSGVAAGQYKLTLTSRTAEKTVNIVLYSSTDYTPLNAKNLIKENQIVLTGANYTSNGVPYFAKTIVIKCGEKVNTYTTDDLGATYTTEATGEDLIPLSWTSEDLTFKITITDAFDKTDTVNYNTINGYDNFYQIGFEGNRVYHTETDTYYAFSTATLTYDSTLVNKFEIFLNGSAAAIASSNYENYGISESGTTIKFTAPENATYSFVIQFYDNATADESFNIVIDTYTPAVTLIDYSKHENKDMVDRMNLSDEDLNTLTSNSLISGDVNLHWDYPTNSNFYYTYSLRKLVGSVWVEEILTSPTTDKHLYDKGDYQLLIKVFGDSNKTNYLGNKVYAFKLAGDEDALYYVEDASGKAIEANSSFKYSELINTETNGGITVSSLTSKFAGQSIPTTNLPLYVLRTETKTIDGVKTTLYPSIVVNEDLVTNEDKIITKITSGAAVTNDTAILTGSNYTFYMYRIETATFSQYFGLLIINETSDFVTSAKIGAYDSVTGLANASSVSQDLTDFAFASNNSSQKYGIQLTQKDSDSLDYLQAKNALVLEVYYNEIAEPIKTVQSSKTLEYEILGNGFYTFVVKDLAGNTQTYGTISKINATILREVVVTVNDEIPIDNGIYNDPVEMRIYASAKYVTGSIVVKAQLNGEDYPLTNYNPCLFKDYGTYKVTITANYNTGTSDPIELTKVLTFTILNDKEARTALDLTSLGGYTLLSVTNSVGNDVTDTFKNLTNLNTSSNAMLITYERLLEYKDDLNISTGKQTYTITYLVEGSDYPAREMTFSFTLNNETPKIDCSLEAGKTTTKGFTISFNAGILYEQIGEAYVMINDEIVATIDETSSFSVIEIERTFKQNGDGDYYIQLVSTSGNVWVSYKATIKEPLNFWAIVIIIVVVVVVVGVTVTIIVLRNKMRIR